MGEYNREEIERYFEEIKEEEESLKQTRTLLEQTKKENEIRKLEKRNFIRRKVLPYALAGTVAVGTIFGAYKLNEDKLKYKKSINDLEKELEIHGGQINEDTGKHIYTTEFIEEHVESGHCQIKDGEKFSDRIDNYCEDHNLPEYIAQAANAKLDYFMENNYGAANKIDLSKIDKMVKENKNSEFIELENGDVLQFNEDGVTYYKPEGEKMSR